jgi:ribose transport system ATP-binding protein
VKEVGVVDTAEASGNLDTSPAASEGALVVEGIDKHFPGVHALKNVTISVLPGEVLGLVGENGAGKSTLMAIAAGSLAADMGTVVIDGQLLEPATPTRAAELGLAIVYQEPALLPDLRVDENLYLAAAAGHSANLHDKTRWADRALSIWPNKSHLQPSTPVRDLSPDRRFITEIAKAIAQSPKVLILDEPTEHLDSSDAEVLFQAIRDLAARGCGIIYISHRVREVKRIADRITVLRDGAVQGTFATTDVTEEDVIRLIVGRQLAAVFPTKPTPTAEEVVLECHELSSHRLSALSFTVRRGEVVGLAGIEDHGQRDVLRSLAGLESASGSVSVEGRQLSLHRPDAAAKLRIAYLPNDRHREGIFPAMSVRENVTARVLPRLVRTGLVRASKERDQATRNVKELGVRTPSIETRISTLSGGNQQKVVIGRALSDAPALILADEPTQGVDVGARSEIYEILHEAARQGSAALVVSSDAAELAGLCTRVLVFSRGKVVAELHGEEVTENRITGAVLTSTTARDARQISDRRPLANLMRSDLSPSIIVALAVVALGAYAASQNSFYLTSRNFNGLLGLFAALGFVALAQQVVMMIGAIDLSVGPLAGLTVVAGSFLVSEGKSGGALAVGVVALAAIAVAVGGLNWALVSLLQITPMIATLVTYTLLQGISLLLRPNPGGVISTHLTDALSQTVGFVPVSAIVVVVLGVALEIALYHTPWGLRLRAVGSKPSAAAQVGVRNRTVTLGAYVLCAFGAFLAGLLVMAQVGSGDASAGTSYTLPSITAVVLGGATIFGGRGSFVGALLGALLIQQLNTVTVFLHLSDAWQFYLLGGLTLLATGFYSLARTSR